MRNGIAIANTVSDMAYVELQQMTEESVGIHWLDEIQVCSVRVPSRDVGWLATRGQHNDVGCSGPHKLFDGVAYFKARHTRYHHIQNNSLWPLTKNNVQSSLSIAGRYHFKAGVPYGKRQQLPDLSVVFYYRDLGHGLSF